MNIDQISEMIYYHKSISCADKDDTINRDWPSKKVFLVKFHVRINCFYVYTFPFCPMYTHRHTVVQLAGDAEYIDCISAEK